jgi:hypothetical protein
MAKQREPKENSRKIIFYSIPLNGERILVSLQPQFSAKCQLEYAVCYRGSRVGVAKTPEEGLSLILQGLQEDLQARVDEGRRAQKILDQFKDYAQAVKTIKGYRIKNS